VLREIIPMPNLDSQTILLAIVAVTALAVLLQAIILLAIFITVRKAARSLKEQAEDLRSSLMPIIYNARDLFTRLAPKVEATVTDVAELTHGLREQSAEVRSTVAHVLVRVNRQTNRVDAMLTGILDAVDRASGFVTDAVSRPMRQLSRILASAKAIVESLRNAEPVPREMRSHGDPSSSDKDIFV
jgi:ABC-type transporter Mla subunit MlaD